MEFYEVINDLNNNCENLMFTVVDGTHAGEKMIVSAGEPVWRSAEDGFFAGHADDLIAAGTGLIEARGARVFSEMIGSRKELVICGAGHVSMPVINIAKMMGFKVTAIDDREEFIKNALEQGADEGICRSFEDALAGIPGSIDTYFVIVTRGHLSDMDCLRNIVNKPHAYIGMIGSRRKISLVREALEADGVPQEIIESIHMPIGLDIGAETPEEIAVAIMAEIIAIKSELKRNSGFTREIIHALSGDRGSAVLATILSKQGSSPRSPGTRMLTGIKGVIAGTIGGGLGEARAIEKAFGMLLPVSSGGTKKEAVRPVVMKVDMSGRDISGSDMICGGAIEIMLEIV